VRLVCKLFIHSYIFLICLHPRSGGKAAPRTGLRGTALHDKTPFVNRQANGVSHAGGKNVQIVMTPLQPVRERTPESSALPSASRARLRTPRDAFKTPAPSGPPLWDESDASFELQQSHTSLAQSASHTFDQDNEDIEYMPPSAISSSHICSCSYDSYLPLSNSSRIRPAIPDARL
jgi:hypothetical protein